MAGILITRPNHDQITTYISQWSGLVIDVAKLKRNIVFDLLGKKAVRKIFEHYLISNEPSFLFLNGHGSSDVICGYNDEVILDQTTNKNLLIDLSQNKKHHLPFPKYRLTCVFGNWSGEVVEGSNVPER